MQILGIWSYSLYLWQQPIRQLSQQQATSGDVKHLAYFAVTMAIGLMSLYWFEIPVRRYLNSKWK